MKLFSKKEIQKKKGESLAVTAKKGLAVAKEMDKNLKKLKKMKDLRKEFEDSFEEFKHEMAIKKKTLKGEVDNLRFERAKEMVPVDELKLEAVNRMKEVEIKEFNVVQRELQHENKLDDLKDEMDIVASRWGETRLMEDRLGKREYSVSQEEARVLKKNKVITQQIKVLSDNEKEFEKQSKAREYDLSLKDNEVKAYWKAMEKRESDNQKEGRRLLLWERRLARHQKRLTQ